MEKEGGYRDTEAGKGRGEKGEGFREEGLGREDKDWKNERKWQGKWNCNRDKCLWHMHSKVCYRKICLCHCFMVIAQTHVQAVATVH